MFAKKEQIHFLTSANVALQAVFKIELKRLEARQGGLTLANKKPPLLAPSLSRGGRFAFELRNLLSHTYASPRRRSSSVSSRFLFIKVRISSVYILVKRYKYYLDRPFCV